MKIVSFTEARNQLKAILDRVVNDADYTIITRRDADAGDAVVMSLEYFNSLLETVHLLKSPANAAHLERSIAQYKQGRVTQKDLLDE
jgi:antitoxin YefM